MTPREHDTPKDAALASHVDDDWLLELLVDDELTADQRDDLLARLDAQSDGWKRCAAVFLEAQALRRAVRAAQTEAVGQASRLSRPEEPFDGRDARPTAQPLAVRPPSRFRLRRFIPAAAAALLAFAAGVIVANAVHTPSAAPRRANIAVAPSTHDVPAGSVQAADHRDVPPLAALTTADPRPFVFNQQQVNGVPRYTTHEAVPLFMLQAIRDAGHEVEFVRQSVPVTMDDGQQIDVPLIETRITPKRRFDL